MSDDRQQDTSPPDSLSSTEREKRYCEATSKKTGERCKAFAMHGSTMCAGHAGKGFGADPSQAARKSAEVRSGQAEVRRKRLRDALADAVEGELHEAIVAAYRTALVSGEAGERLRAAEALLSRVYGKPKETVETVQRERPKELQEIADMTPEERDALWRELEGVTAA